MTKYKIILHCYEDDDIYKEGKEFYYKKWLY